MRIAKVGYARLRSFGSFENERVSAEAEVDPGEDSGLVLEELRGWVAARLQLADEVRGLRAERDSLAWNLERGRRDLARLESLRGQHRGALAAVGIDHLDLPF